jgi:hypothetical protein
VIDVAGEGVAYYVPEHLLPLINDILILGG